MAKQEARRVDAEIDGSHLLVGLLKEGSGIGALILTKLGVTLKAIREEAEAIRAAGLPQPVERTVYVLEGGKRIDVSSIR